MPQTTVYGFEFEHLDQAEPTRTLNGGSAGTSPILAEQVEGELVRVEGDIASVESDVAALQDRVLGWTRIAEGTAADTFSIDLTAGGKFSVPLPFGLIRVYLRGNLTTGARLNCRVNSDSTANLYWNTYQVYELGDGDVLESNSADQTVWTVGRWSSFTGCIATMTIFNTDSQALLSHESTAFSPSSDTGARFRTEAQGRLSASRTLESLLFFPSSGGVDSVRWWAEGWRDS